MIEGKITESETGDHVCSIFMSLFIRGLTGSKFKGLTKRIYPAAPKRTPDVEVSDHVNEN